MWHEDTGGDMRGDLNVHYITDLITGPYGQGVLMPITSPREKYACKLEEALFAPGRDYIGTLFLPPIVSRVDSPRLRRYVCIYVCIATSMFSGEFWR